MTQMRQLNGEFEFEDAHRADPHLGILFALVAFVVLPILLMNLLVAIMFEAYESVNDYAAARFCYLQLFHVRFV